MYPRASGVPDEKSFTRVTGSAEKATLKGLLLVSLLLIVRVVLSGVELTDQGEVSARQAYAGYGKICRSLIFNDDRVIVCFPNYWGYQTIVRIF